MPASARVSLMVSMPSMCGCIGLLARAHTHSACFFCCPPFRLSLVVSWLYRISLAHLVHFWSSTLTLSLPCRLQEAGHPELVSLSLSCVIGGASSAVQDATDFTETESSFIRLTSLVCPLFRLLLLLTNGAQDECQRVRSS